MPKRNAIQPRWKRKPTSPPTAAMRKTTNTLRTRSARVRPASTAERAIGSDLKRSRSPGLRAVESPMAAAAAARESSGDERGRVEVAQRADEERRAAVDHDAQHAALAFRRAVESRGEQLLRGGGVRLLGPAELDDGAAEPRLEGGGRVV